MFKNKHRKRRYPGHKPGFPSRKPRFPSRKPQFPSRGFRGKRKESEVRQRGSEVGRPPGLLELAQTDDLAGAMMEAQIQEQLPGHMRQVLESFCAEDEQVFRQLEDGELEVGGVGRLQSGDFVISYREFASSPLFRTNAYDRWVILRRRQYRSHPELKDYLEARLDSRHDLEPKPPARRPEVQEEDRADDADSGQESKRKRPKAKALAKTHRQLARDHADKNKHLSADDCFEDFCRLCREKGMVEPTRTQHHSWLYK